MFLYALIAKAKARFKSVPPDIDINPYQPDYGPEGPLPGIITGHIMNPPVSGPQRPAGTPYGHVVKLDDGRVVTASLESMVAHLWPYRLIPVNTRVTVALVPRWGYDGYIVDENLK